MPLKYLRYKVSAEDFIASITVDYLDDCFLDFVKETNGYGFTKHGTKEERERIRKEVVKRRAKSLVTRIKKVYALAPANGVFEITIAQDSKKDRPKFSDVVDHYRERLEGGSFVDIKEL